MFSLHPLYLQLARLVEQELLLGMTPAVIREKLCVSDRFMESQCRRLAGRHHPLVANHRENHEYREYARQLIQAGMTASQVANVCPISLHICRRYTVEVNQETIQYGRATRSLNNFYNVLTTTLGRIIGSLFVAAYMGITQPHNEPIAMDKVLIASQKTRALVDKEGLQALGGFNSASTELGFFYLLALKLHGTLPVPSLAPQRSKQRRGIMLQACQQCKRFYIVHYSANTPNIQGCCFCELFTSLLKRAQTTNRTILPH